MDRPARLVGSAHSTTEDNDIGRSVTNSARLAIAAMVLLTGCATIRSWQARDTEELLTAAGFNQQLVDAADTKPLDAGPPYQLVRHNIEVAQSAPARTAIACGTVAPATSTPPSKTKASG